MAGGSAAAAPRAGDRVREVCEEFEALFLSMLLRAMQATVRREGLLQTGTAGEIFDSLWVDEIGRAAARSRPLGIAEMLAAALDDDGVSPGTSSARPPVPKTRLEGRWKRFHGCGGG